MSLLTKIFIILVFVAAVAAVATTGTTFAHRVNYKDLFIKEGNRHYDTIQRKNQEIAYKELEIQNRDRLLAAADLRINSLEAEKAVLSTQIADRERRLTEQMGIAEALRQDLDSLTKSLDTQLAQLREFSNALAEAREMTKKALARKNTAEQELQSVKQLLDSTLKELAALEERHTKLAKSYKLLEIKAEGISRATDHPLPGAPERSIAGKVAAYAPDTGVAILNVGRDQGVMVGMTFTIHRSGNFVARAKVREVQRDWAAATIEFRHMEPMLGDDASNTILTPVTPPAASR